MWVLAGQRKLLFKTGERKILRKIYEPIKDKTDEESEIMMQCMFFFYGATTLVESWSSQQYPSTEGDVVLVLSIL
jgi:hypothetical protein